MKNKVTSKAFPNDKELRYVTMAKKVPDEFLKIIESGELTGENLIYAIEACLAIKNRKKIIPIIIKYIESPIPAIREVVIYILTAKMTVKIKDELLLLYEKEQNESLKEILKKLFKTKKH
ncbi:MAG: hypothetical protein ACOYLO_00650 [Ferruginibacter sp.]